MRCFYTSHPTYAPPLAARGGQVEPVKGLARHDPVHAAVVETGRLGSTVDAGKTRPIAEQALPRLAHLTVGLHADHTQAALQERLGELSRARPHVGHDLAGRVGIDWGVYAVPETFVIDKQGIVRFKHIGPVNDVVIERKLVPLLCQLEQA